jgi:predicted TIM-barrel fold metal-dependent hydrolase
MIIDAETHPVARSRDGQLRDSTPKLIDYMRRNKIDAAIILPGAGESNVAGKYLEDMAKKDRIRLIPFCRFAYEESYSSSSQKADDSAEADVDQLARMLRSGIFRGVGELSLIQLGNDDPLRSARAFYLFMDVVSKFKVPVQFHTGTGVGNPLPAHTNRSVPARFFDPINIDDLASRYSEIPFIINHCGGMLSPFSDTSLYVAAKNFNVYLIISNLNLVGDDEGTEVYAKFVEKALNHFGVGAERLIFASDWYPEFASVGLPEKTIRALSGVKMTEREREMIMGGNIRKLLRI